MDTAQLLPGFSEEKSRSNGDANKLGAEDQAVHGWYRFVLSYPPHLVRQYLKQWDIRSTQCVLDPFSGTGTTCVEAQKLGIQAVGVEAHPMAHFASRTKLDWTPDSNELVEQAQAIADQVRRDLKTGKTTDLLVDKQLLCLPQDSEDILLTDSISPLPLHKILALREGITRSAGATSTHHHHRLALAKIAVGVASNLKFGPEVGVGPIKQDAPVVETWLEAVLKMAGDLRHLNHQPATARMVHGDAREIQRHLEPNSIDAVITSPPYPNEKDYSRTTRLETMLLGFATNKKELQAIKRGLLRSNTRNVYKGDDDDQWVEHLLPVQEIATEIERRRVEMGKTSGFERLYAKVTKLYFGGMARHLAELRPFLRRGARLGYVVGDQASFLRVKIPTGEILAQIATRLGFTFVGLDLFRTRLSTATKEMLREEVLVLEWPGVADT